VDELIQWFDQLPRSVIWFLGFIAFFLGAILSGDRKLWEYEVKFPLKKGVGRGEVEIKCLKKKGISIEVEMELEECLRNEAIDIELAGRLIHTIPAKDNNAARIVHRSPLKLDKPNEGDLLSIRIKGNPVQSGHLVID